MRSRFWLRTGALAGTVALGTLVACSNLPTLPTSGTDGEQVGNTTPITNGTGGGSTGTSAGGSSTTGGGFAPTISSWATASTNFPATGVSIQNHAATLVGNTMYVVGGASPSVGGFPTLVNTVYSGTLATSNMMFTTAGTVATNSFTSPSYSYTGVCSNELFADANGGLHLPGGILNTNSQAAATGSWSATPAGGFVNFAADAANGTLNGLGTGLTNYAGAELNTASGSWIYLIGGNSVGGGAPLNSFYIGTVSGSNVSWVLNTSPGFPPGYTGSSAGTALGAASVVWVPNNNGTAATPYLYVMGGVIPQSGGMGSTPVASVYFLQLNPSSGQPVGSWKTASSMLIPDCNMLVVGATRSATVSGVATSSAFIYVLGGYAGTPTIAPKDLPSGQPVEPYATAEVMYAQLNSDGSLGSWQYMPTLLPQRDQYVTGGIDSQGRIWIAGGSDGSNPPNPIRDVYVGTIGQ